ncbi:MAG: hypothetical protein C0424_01835 [Sphingobacteriaceae bacterium]|nr:hypothetical protein [Sphingobacteriaceae bacterium]
MGRPFSFSGIEICKNATAAAYEFYLTYIRLSKSIVENIMKPKVHLQYLLFCCLLVFSNVLFAQQLFAQQTDSLYLDESGKLTSESNYGALRVIKQDGDGMVHVTDFYANGNLKFECTYLSSAKKRHPPTDFLTVQTYEKKDGLALNGRYAIYYQSGQLRELGNYQKGKSTGIYQHFLENGQPYYRITEEMPLYEGGDAKLVSDLKAAMKAVKAKYDLTQTGRVVVTFLVDSTGKCVNHRILRSDHEQLNEPALEAISQINQVWRPGKMRGEAVNVEYNIPMVF